MAEQQLAVYLTRAGHPVTVVQIDGEDPGTAWRCAGCGDHTDWPYSDTTLDPVCLIKTAATTHALTCRT